MSESSATAVMDAGGPVTAVGEPLLQVRGLSIAGDWMKS